MGQSEQPAVGTAAGMTLGLGERTHRGKGATPKVFYSAAIWVRPRALVAQTPSATNNLTIPATLERGSAWTRDALWNRCSGDNAAPGAKFQCNDTCNGRKSVSLWLHELLLRDKPLLKDGYAPFCKHIFVENFTDANVATLQISEDNQKLLRTGYIARRPEELPVLCRWLPASLVEHQLSRAKYLDLILYSREQIAKEAAAMSKSEEIVVDPSAPEWSIISIKAQNEPFEIPMNPITMMRNALIEEGGSGVSIDRAAYMRSVEYWSNHAIVQVDDT
ncbi:hypothetical protein Efla_005335 [Eimeria flavescens]